MLDKEIILPSLVSPSITDRLDGQTDPHSRHQAQQEPEVKWTRTEEALKCQRLWWQRGLSGGAPGRAWWGGRKGPVSLDTTHQALVGKRWAGVMKGCEHQLQVAWPDEPTPGLSSLTISLIHSVLHLLRSFPDCFLSVYIAFHWVCLLTIMLATYNGRISKSACVPSSHF
jgi:hypothetical protein